jgi:hypothetical protein
MDLKPNVKYCVHVIYRCFAHLTKYPVVFYASPFDILLIDKLPSKDKVKPIERGNSWRAWQNKSKH